MAANKHTGATAWQPEVQASVAAYNDWYMVAAPVAFTEAREQAGDVVGRAVRMTAARRPGFNVY